MSPSKDKTPPTDAGSIDSAQTHRLIKKYPNRRLYDTKTSSYVTLNEVKKFVIEGEALKVIDAKTEEDLTRSIFLQIILEEEAAGLPLFSEIALANIIRFYGHSMQSMMGNYLEKNIQSFSNFQQQMSEQIKPLSPEAWNQMMTDPSRSVQALMANYAQQSNQLVSQMHEHMAKAMGLKK